MTSVVVTYMVVKNELPQFHLKDASLMDSCRNMCGSASLSQILSSTATTVTKSVSLGGSENRIKIAKAGAVNDLLFRSVVLC
ncbi:hypothetical protein Bca101_029083 [Brassica carinata]